MAATEKGVWNIQEVRDKQLASEWSYEGLATLYSWGTNEYGQLGFNQPDNSHKSSPTQLPGTWSTNVSSGQDSCAAIKSDGTMWCWGLNNVGQLGQNTTGPGANDQSSPCQVGTNTNWTTVTTGRWYNMATKTDGTLWVWGVNQSGNLGKNTINDSRSSPIQIGTETTWAGVKAGPDTSFATKTDGTLWAWGQNWRGTLGQNNTTNYSSPIQVGTDTNWATGMDKFSCSKSYDVFAVKTDGTLWSWGYGNAGALGLGDNNRRSSPTQIPGSTWSKIGSRAYGATCIRTDGTLWNWGYNDNGECGNSSPTSSFNSPVQLPGTNWNIVLEAYQGYTGAIKTDGTFWMWGKNNKGGLGQNNRTNYSSPKQVGTDTNWAGGNLGNYNSLAIVEL